MQNYSFLVESNIYMQEGFWGDLWDKTKHGAHKVANTVVKGHREGRSQREKIRNEHPILSKVSDAIETIQDARAGNKAGQKAINSGDTYAAAAAKAGLASAKKRLKREAGKHAFDTIYGAIRRGKKAHDLKKARREAGGSTFKKD